MYRLRDERGLFCDLWAEGLTRRAILAAGKPLAENGRIAYPTHLVEAGYDEMRSLIQHDDGPSAEELAQRARYRAEVARFLAAHLEGSLAPLHAASLAAATPAERVPAAEERLSAVDTLPGGFRTLVKVALPGATKRVEIESLTTADEPGLG